MLTLIIISTINKIIDENYLTWLAFREIRICLIQTNQIIYLTI